MTGRRKQPPKRYACTRCSKLRVKCVPLTTGACQRCTRLGHPSDTCVFPAEIRGSPIPTLTLTSAPITRAPTPKPAFESTGAANPSDLRSNGENEVLFHSAITTHLANALLAKYIAHKQPLFPFVVIQPGSTVKALHKKSPFLLLCVLTASLEYDPSLQDELEAVVRKEIAARVVVAIERNLDILQGLLVHAAWYHYHWRTYHTHGYMLLQMVVMIIADLGLDRQEGFRMRTIPVDEKKADDAGAKSAADELKKRNTQDTAAEQRALLGCYYLCSSLSRFREQVRMRPSPWIDQCAESLKANPEYPTDANLKSYVKVQCLMHQSRLLYDSARRCPTHQIPSIWEQILELTAEAQTEYSLISTGAPHNWPLRIELEGAPALILGQALGSQAHVLKLQEMNQLRTLTASAHQVLDTFVAAPISAIIHLPASAYAATWYCLLIVSKLSLLFLPNKQQAIELGVDTKSIHNRAAALMHKFQDSFPKEEGFWTSSGKVIANMLAWIGKSSIDARPESASTDKHTHPEPDSNRNSLADDHSQPQRESPTSHWKSYSHFTSSTEQAMPMDLQFTITDGLEGEIWQQMLESFTWLGPMTEDNLNDGPYHM